MNRARLALTAGISIVLVFLSFPGISIAKWGKDYRKQTFSIMLIWKTSGEEKLLSEDEGFPPQKIKEELERNDAPEEEKEWLLNALRIIVARQERVLYTNNGRAIDLSKDGQLKWRITPSKNFKYLMLCPLRWHWEPKLVLEGTQKQEYQRQEKESAFILMDWQGNELWRLYNMRRTVYVSDDGKTVVATHDGWRFSSSSYYDFYDEKGEKAGESEFPYGNDGSADLSADGRCLVVIGGLYAGGGYSTLVRYNRRGEELWKRRLKGRPNFGGDLKPVYVSNYGSFTGACVREKSYLLDEDGNLIGQLDIPGVDYQVFSTDADRLVLLSNRELQYVTTNPLSALWSFEPDYDVSFLGTAVILSNRELVAATVITHSAPHKSDVCILYDGRILDTILTLDGKGAWLLSSPNGCFFVVSSETVCAVYSVQGGRWTPKSRPRFLMSTVRETDVYATSDTLEHIGNLPQDMIVRLREIGGDNEWVRIESGEIEGWVRTNNVRFELSSFVEGYKLNLMGGLATSPDEFEARAGITWKEAGELSFETKDQARAFGDSLVSKGLLYQEAATGYYYYPWFVFKNGFPNLHLSWSGNGDPIGHYAYVSKCPVCEDVLCKAFEPDEHVDRIKDSRRYNDYTLKGKEGAGINTLEIYQCVRGHLVVVQKIPID